MARCPKCSNHSFRLVDATLAISGAATPLCILECFVCGVAISTVPFNNGSTEIQVAHLSDEIAAIRRQLSDITSYLRTMG